MIGTTILVLVLAALLVAAVKQYPHARRELMRETRMHAAETDDYRCDVCQRVSGIRELVMLHDDVALCCLTCATVLKAQPGLPRQEAA